MLKNKYLEEKEISGRRRIQKKNLEEEYRRKRKIWKKKNLGKMKK